MESHETYFMNLTEANEVGKPRWVLEYSTSELGMESLDVEDWDNLVRRMATEDDLFNRMLG